MSYHLYARQRFFDPQLARWLTPDPIGFSGGLNLYTAMENDPVGNADPSGLEVGYDYTQQGVMRPGIDTSRGFNRTAAGIALGALAVATAPEFAVAGMMGSIARGYAAAGLQHAARTWGAAAVGYVGAGLVALWTGVSTGLRGSGRCPTRSRRGFALTPGGSGTPKHGPSVVGPSVDGFIQGNLRRIRQKLGDKLGEGRLPFTMNRSGFDAAMREIKTTLEQATEVSRSFRNRSGHNCRDIHSAVTGSTVRVREGEVFDTLIPERTGR